MKNIQADIKSGNFKQVYLLYGEEAYLKQQYKIVGWVFLGLVILFSVTESGKGTESGWGYYELPSL